MTTATQHHSLEAILLRSSKAFNNALVQADVTLLIQYYDAVGLMSHRAGLSYLGRDDIAIYWKNLFSAYGEPLHGNILATRFADGKSAYVDSFLAYERGRGIMMKEHWTIDDFGRASIVYHTLSAVGLDAEPEPALSHSA